MNDDRTPLIKGSNFETKFMGSNFVVIRIVDHFG